MDSGQRDHAVSALKRPLLYAITDGTGRVVVEQVATAARAGVDLIQIREPGLESQALYELCLSAREAIHGSRVRLLLNRRFGVALAAKLDGVHLPARGLPVSAVRQHGPAGFCVGVSCHTLAEVDAASAAGADFCVFGPVFPSPGKGDPVGLEALRRAAQRPIPVLALGGVTADNASQCWERGAAGVAGIRLFAPGRVAETVAALRNLAPGNCVE